MRRPSRRGQVVFLEFAGTLPIWCILFMGMMSFHRHYQNSRHAMAIARLNTDVNLDTHHSKLNPPQKLADVEQETKRIKTKDTLAQLTPPVDHLVVNEFVTYHLRNVTRSTWWEKATAGGRHQSGRDNWSHWDIDRQIQRENVQGLQKNAPQESMKFIFHLPNANDELTKGFLRI